MDKRQIQKLVDAGIIDASKGEEIERFFQLEEGKKPNRLFVIFAIIGALLVGLGLIAIVASNWEHFSKNLKTVFAFLPLITAQGLCFFTLLKQSNSRTWREGNAILLLFALGAGIVLLSEMYHHTPSPKEYLFVWILLSIPIVYLMQASMASLLCYLGIAFFSTEFSNAPLGLESYFFILFFIALIPFYYQLIKKSPNGNFTTFHHIVFPISLLFCLANLIDQHHGVLALLIILLSSIAIMGSHFSIFKSTDRTQNKSLKLLGSFGLTASIFFYTFYDFWRNRRFFDHGQMDFYQSHAFIILIIFTIIATITFVMLRKKNISVSPLIYIFPVAIISFFIGIYLPVVGVVLFNVLAILIGLHFIKEGNAKNHLLSLNIGMLIFALVIGFRFMDIDMNVAWKGLVFIFLGIGFFLTNFYMLRKRKTSG